MSIEVIAPGLQTTIQDLGRRGWSHMGVPESGAADKFSLKVANFLLSKDIDRSKLKVFKILLFSNHWCRYES